MANFVSIMMKSGIRKILLYSLLLTFLFACTDNETEPEGPWLGKITFRFHHYCDSQVLDFDTRKYVNEAGNEYLVNEIQYFISDVTLHNPNVDLMIQEWKDIHYVDTDIPTTHEWNVYDEIPEGDYTRISFTFGINEEKNQSLMFTDPPESLMFWPEYLGGGYHYLKLNGKWLDTNSLERPYNFHLGIGQIYDPDSGDITGFIQNYFEIELPESGFTVVRDQETVINIVMHVDRWFKNPHTYDHNYWGGDIMQKQDAMKVGCENGHDVYEVLSVEF